jgi:formiminoglutamase
LLQNWLSPISAALLKRADATEPYQIGRQAVLFRDARKPPALTHTRVALIGLDAKAADAMRPHFYALSCPYEGFEIADLGNVRKNQTETIVPILQELLTARIVPILLGGSDLEQPLLQYHAYRQLNYLLNMGIITDRLPCSAVGNWQMQPQFWLNRLLSQPNTYLFNLSVLGFQSHFTDPKGIAFLEQKSYEYLRLGKIKNSLEDCEPLLRDADTIALNLAALKFADAPAACNASPNGLAAEEVCKIVRYAGLSDKLTSFGVYNYEPQHDHTTQTAQLIAQVVWYFIDGLYNRKQDYPIRPEHFKQYLVDVQGYDKPLVFLKSNRSERWWLQVPNPTAAQQRHQLFPCSYSDYQRATEGELSDRLLLAYYRFS